jgi:hypothetical protein
MKPERTKEERTKEELSKKPGREDVHEQREASQPREGVVKKVRAPQVSQQSILDEQRAEGEGMGQPQAPPQK